MDNLTLTVKKNLQSIICQDNEKELIVAYSGGVDSQVLLHALVQLSQENIIVNPITVCHVNHGLSNNAVTWQNFAKQMCDKLSVSLIVKCVDIKPIAQHSLEALARDARYNALKSLRDKASIVLTGHHSDDQTETFLLALKRGAGLKGLSAMSKTLPLAQHILARPLLEITRQEIVEYAQKHELSWVEDESNIDTSFDRNFIRQEVMPLLRERWPSISNTINRSAIHCAAGQELLEELAQQDLIESDLEVESAIKLGKVNANTVGEFSLAISTLTKLSPARFNNLIRFFMAKHDCLMPSTLQLKQVQEQLTSLEDKSPQIKVGDYFFRRFKGFLYLTADYDDVSHKQINIELSPASHTESRIQLPDNLGVLIFSSNVNEKLLADSMSNNPVLPAISFPSEGQKVTIRFSHNNPKCEPHFRQHSRSLKKVLQELSIPPWQRKRIAFLYYDEHLVAAIGLFVCKPFMGDEHDISLSVYRSTD